MTLHTGSNRPRIENENGLAVLVCRDGTRYVLTYLEKLMLRAGAYTLEKLDRLHNNKPQKG